MSSTVEAGHSGTATVPADVAPLPFSELAPAKHKIQRVLAEFPRGLVPLLRCCRDAAPLGLTAERSVGEVGLIEATLTCTACAHDYQIIDGIVHLLAEGLTAEDEHEIALRDVEFGTGLGEPFVAPAKGWRSALNDEMELPPFLAALKPLNNKSVLEIGCGDGRLTLLMAQLGATVLAVDFSLGALTKLAAWLPVGVAPTAYVPPHGNHGGDMRPRIGLVQADASQFHAAPASFDRILSTTPLDSRAQRLALYASLATTLKDDGHFLGSVEHDDLYRRVLGQPVARRYDEGGIFIEHFSADTIRRETAPFFGDVIVSPIRPGLPLLGRLPPRVLVWLARFVEQIPGLNQLGEILLFKATKPIRPAVEGAERRGLPFLKALQAWRHKS